MMTKSTVLLQNYSCSYVLLVIFWVKMYFFDRYVHWKRLDPNACMGSLGTRCRVIMAEKLGSIALSAVAEKIYMSYNIPSQLSTHHQPLASHTTRMHSLAIKIEPLVKIPYWSRIICCINFGQPVTDLVFCRSQLPWFPIVMQLIMPLSHYRFPDSA